MAANSTDAWRIDRGEGMRKNNMLTRFVEEVLKAGPEATLPCNLNEYWLGELQDHLKR